MTRAAPYTIDEQLAEVRRELRMRRHVYPRFVEQKRYTQDEADEQIALLEAVAETLVRVRYANEPDLFVEQFGRRAPEAEQGDSDLPP